MGKISNKDSQDKKDTIIVNFAELAITQERVIALKIASRGLEAINSSQVIKNTVRLNDRTLVISGKPFNLPADGKLIVVAVGKCAIDATKALEEILGNMITMGVVLDIRENNVCQFNNIECFVGTHPSPTDANTVATKKIIEAISGLSENDTVLFVISGGGSTLLCLPTGGATCVDEQVIVKELFKAGAPIQELNTVRKHMSLGRGGHLAKSAYPAQVISLIFSDVPGNDISFVSSGPTVKDCTTIHDAEQILSKYGILKKSGLGHEAFVETPKEEKYFEKVYNTVVVSNELALKAMEDEAKSLGMSPSIRTANIIGEAQEVGRQIANEISKCSPGTVLLYGGETTVVVKAHGRGGRNQQLTLSALEHSKNGDLIISLASDGRDYGTYAGAIADDVTKDKANSKELVPRKYIDDNDATTFFESTGDLILTGDTGSNVSDLIIALNKL